MILGTDWKDQATLDKNLQPFRGLEMKYYHTSDGRYFRLVESGSGLSVLTVYESETAYRVASKPIDYTAEFREQFKYTPDADELSAQVAALLDFWQAGLKLDLGMPLLIKRAGLGDTMEVKYLGYRITANRDGRQRAYLKLLNVEGGSEFDYQIIHFSPEWTAIIPRQRPSKQLCLF